MWYRHGSRHYSERPCSAAGAASWRRRHQRWGWHTARRAFNSSHQEGWSPSASIHSILAPCYGKSIDVNPDYAHQPPMQSPGERNYVQFTGLGFSQA